MSTLQRKGRIGISLVLALLMVFSVVATVSAADTAANSIVAPTVGPDYAGNSTIYAYGGGDSASKDSWISWKGASDGTKYLCLPSSVDRNVYFYSTYSSDVTVENINDASDKFTLTSNAVNGPFNRYNKNISGEKGQHCSLHLEIQAFRGGRRPVYHNDGQKRKLCRQLELYLPG